MKIESEIRNVEPGVDYDLLNQQVAALLAGETDLLANSCNFVAQIYDVIPDVNWLGIYVLRGEQLVLGPFQGKPACERIDMGKGVCGTAAATNSSQRIDDVHEFPGHIACDAASNSEIVVPIRHEGKVVAVLDIDSPTFGRFSASDQAGVEMLCRTFEFMLLRCASNAASMRPGFI